MDNERLSSLSVVVQRERQLNIWLLIRIILVFGWLFLVKTTSLIATCPTTAARAIFTLRLRFDLPAKSFWRHFAPASLQYAIERRRVVARCPRDVYPSRRCTHHDVAGILAIFDGSLN
jgi:hypothetical protein